MKLLRLYLAFAPMMIAHSISASEIQTTVLFNHPSCKEYTYKFPLKSYNGINGPKQVNSKLIASKTKDIYCRPSDFPTKEIIASPAFKALAKLFAEPNLLHVDGAFFLFESNELVDEICATYAVKPFKMTLTLQRAPYSEATKKLQRCLGKDISLQSIGCDWLTAPEGCKNSSINTMHAKILRFKLKDGSKKFIYGSGNINYSLYGTRDVWLHTVVSGSDGEGGISEQLNCQVEVLINPYFTKPFKVLELANEYSNCIKRVRALNTNEFTAYLIPMKWLPGGRDPILDDVLPKLFSTATSIFITTQDLGGRKILNMIEGFVSRGGQLRLLLDDDWFYVRFLGSDFGMASAELAENWLSVMAQKYPKNITIRYLETDNTASFQTSLHHKFIVFEGNQKPTVLFGSPNIKDSALTKNIETVYVVREKNIIDSFLKESSYLWGKGRANDEMPFIDSNEFK